MLKELLLKMLEKKAITWCGLAKFRETILNKDVTIVVPKYNFNVHFFIIWNGEEEHRRRDF